MRSKSWRDSRSNLLHFLNPLQYRPGDGLIRRVDGEDLRHVALAFFEEHGGAVGGTVFAELVVQGLIKRRHGSVDSRIELRRREEQGHFGLLESRQARSRQLYRWIDRGRRCSAASRTSALRRN